MTTARLTAFLDAAPAAAMVEVREALGSTPREAGAWMLVSPDAIFGTIGGGQLEFMAIARAREMLAAQPSPLRGGSARSAGVGVGVAQDGARPSPPPPGSPEGGGEALVLSIPLGPEICQCCGGKVELSIAPLDDAKRRELTQRVAAEDAQRPHVYLFGGGHVGHALAEALSLLPLHVEVVETRPEALEGLVPAVRATATAVPEETVRAARPASAFVVLTHDHALDFLIVAEALARADAAYVGMIGSKTKRATFRNWYLREAGGDEADLARLVCPIGGGALRDKRPAVIAALAAAEIALAVLSPRDAC